METWLDWEGLLTNSQTISVDGTEVHHYDLGNGSPIVLLHGGGLASCSELNWGSVLGPLSDSCRVIALDQPGFGYTSPRGDQDCYPQHRADFVVEFIQKKNLSNVTVVGNSRAGYQAAYLALEYPELISKLVLVNAGSVSRKLMPGEIPGDLSSPKPTRESAAKSIEEMADGYLLSPGKHPFWNGKITDEKIDWFYNLQRRNWEFTQLRNDKIQQSAESLNSALSYKNKHITEWHSSIQCPTLVTWSTRPYVGWPKSSPEDNKSEPKLVTLRYQTLDSHKRDEGFDMGIRTFEKIPNAELHLWQNANHHLMTDHAERWSQVVKSFVSDS